jgi:hypothetical protein
MASKTSLLISPHLEGWELQDLPHFSQNEDIEAEDK